MLAPVRFGWGDGVQKKLYKIGTKARRRSRRLANPGESSVAQLDRVPSGTERSKDFLKIR